MWSHQLAADNFISLLGTDGAFRLDTIHFNAIAKNLRGRESQHSIRFANVRFTFRWPKIRLWNERHRHFQIEIHPKRESSHPNAVHRQFIFLIKR